MHRRRQLTDNGFQPLTFGEITTFSREVLDLPQRLHRFFVRVMEEADNAVLHDHYLRVEKDIQKAKAEAGRNGRGNRRK